MNTVNAIEWLLSRMSNCVLVPPDHASVEISEDELGMWFHDEAGFWVDGRLVYVPYPHYAFPRALPIELKGIAV